MFPLLFADLSQSQCKILVSIIPEALRHQDRRKETGRHRAQPKTIKIRILNRNLPTIGLQQAFKVLPKQ